SGLTPPGDRPRFALPRTSLVQRRPPRPALGPPDARPVCPYSSSPSLNFGSWSFDTFLSCQVMVPVSLAPSFLMARVEVRFTWPTSVTQLQVPTGSALAPRAEAGRTPRAPT